MEHASLETAAPAAGRGTPFSVRLGSALDRNRSILFFLGFCFVLYSAWSFLTPTTSAPDEDMRLDLVRYMMANGRLPRGDEPSLRHEIWGFSYGYVPYTPQILGAFLGTLAESVTANAALVLYAIRLPSILFGVGAVWFMWLTGLRLMSRRATWFLVVLLATWPQLAFLAGYTNVDTMAVFAVSMLLLAWVRGLQTRWDSRATWTLAVGLGVLALSYYNAFGFGLLSVLLWLWCNVVRPSTRKPARAWLADAALVVGVVVVLAGWFYVRNAIHLDGDFLGLRSTDAARAAYGLDWIQVDQRASRSLGPLSQMLFGPQAWVSISLRSFVAWFSYMTVLPPSWVYTVYKVLVGAGALGVLVLLAARRTPVRTPVTLTLVPFLAVGAVIPVVLSVYRSYVSDFQPQGRYLMPALPALVLLVVLGLVALRQQLTRVSSVGPALVVAYAVLAAVHAACLLVVFFATFVPIGAGG